MRRVLLTMLLCCLTLGRAFAETPTPTERHWTIEGVERKALLCVPAAATKTKTPVIFAFHGHGGNMQYAARKFDYQRLWPEAIVVYMQGLPTVGQLTDPTGRKNGWQRTAGDQKDRDLKFFDAVLASLKREYQVDEKRIFATGHSNGGGFTFLLWAERGDTFAAVAPASAVAAQALGRMKPKPALEVAGETDELVRYNWQKQMMEAVRRRNGCDTTGKAWAKSGTLTGTLYPSKSGTPFVSVIYPGGHAFPEEAPALIVKFFKEQTGVAKTEAALQTAK